MLTVAELTQALADAQAQAGVCTRFCRVGGSRGERDYRCWHNAIGCSDTQTLLAETAASLTLDQLRARLTDWLKAHHRREPYCLTRGGRP